MLMNNNDVIRKNDTTRIAVALLDRFSHIALSSCIEPLRLANRVSERTLYSWKTYSKDGQPVCPSNEMMCVVDGSFDDISDVDILLVCSGLNVERITVPSSLTKKLRYVSSHGGTIGSLCTGAYVLAKAGLLDGYRCTVHWENQKSLMEDFPNVEVSSLLFDIDRNRITAAGGTAPLDLMLNLVTMQYGVSIANSVADIMIHHRIRYGDEPQRANLRMRLGVSHPKLLDVIEMMENNLETPMRCADLAQAVSLSNRQLERLFNKYVGCKPSRFYMQLRLDQARLMLQQTSSPIINVAFACGFVSASHFSKCYHERFKHTPSEERLGNRAKVSI